MIERKRTSPATWVASALFALTASPTLLAQTPPQVTGELATHKYKDIQVLKALQADQVPITMTYFSAALGEGCSGCHQADRSTGKLDFAANTRSKDTAREMIRIVETVNTANFKTKINCGTCHQGHERPVGLQAASMMTSEEILQGNLQTIAAAMRASSPPPPGAGVAGPGGPPAGARPAGPGAGGGRGPQPGPPPADVLKKFTDALGNSTASWQTRVVTGTVTTRTAQAMTFSVSEKEQMYVQTLETKPAPRTVGFDGTASWPKVEDKLRGFGSDFSIDPALRVTDPDFAATLLSKYPALQSTKRSQMALTSGSTPIDVNILTGISGTTTEQFYFDAATGLLVRHVTMTATPLNGSLNEIVDYANYRPESGHLMAHKITYDTWKTFDTFTISKVTLNGEVDESVFKNPQ